MNKKALIIGCGIAGPALALFLRRAGIDSVVYDSRREPDDDAGVFLNVMPNGVNVLRLLGVEEAVRRHGFDSNRIVFHNSAGTEIGELDNRDEEQRYGARSIIVKRGFLNRALRDAALAAASPIEFGKRLEGFDDGGGDGVTVRFDDGTEAHGDFLVGADGVHSPTRRRLLPEGPQPRYLGLLNCGGFARYAASPPSGTMHMTFGKQGFFGYQAVPSGEVYWFSNFGAGEPRRGELASVSSEDWKRRLSALHDGDHEPIRTIVAATDGEIGAWRTYDLPFLPTWHRGNVCLIGDAAHATSPSAGQGASLALEDAAVLAQCLRDLPNVPAAFDAFQAIRKKRVEKVIEQARRNGSQKAVSNPIQLWFRDRLLRHFLRKGVEANRWIYRYRVAWDEQVRAAA